LRYALSLPNGGVCGDPLFLVDLAQTAEAAGWDAILLEDYLDYQGKNLPTCDPWVALAAMSMKTQRVLLGTAVTPVARRRPWRLAQEVATVDRLSGGRAVLGVGAGDPRDPTYAMVGEQTDVRTRAAMLDEALTMISALWSGEPLNFTGDHYQVSGLTLHLTPVQRPRVPIWVGGLWPRRATVQRAARWDGALLGFKAGANGEEIAMTPTDVQALVSDIRRLRTMDGYDVIMGGRARNPDEAAELRWIRMMADAGATWWMEWLPPAPAHTMRSAVGRGPLRI
jgi:alkanesulfonate monooxygenase SsuD/methylene tetrahydromethanopterin reductase-like flavin-dependent oxidoreductase (luciferase family)